MERSIFEVRRAGQQRLVGHLPGLAEATYVQDVDTLLCEVMGVRREHLLMSPEQEVEDEHYAKFLELLQRRIAGEPLAYVLGHAEFYGHNFLVSPSVLIPRPETEYLVSAALQLLEHDVLFQASWRCVDVGTGSGAIILSVALASQPGQGSFLGVDVSEEALCIARQNAERLGVAERVNFLTSDLLREVPEVDASTLVLANLPYIADKEALSPEVSEFEPSLALRGGDDGLSLIRRLLEQLAEDTKKRKSFVALLEIGYEQFDAVESLAGSLGLTCSGYVKDAHGIKRVIEIRG